MNGLLVYCGWVDLKVKPLKIQKLMFSTSEKELSRDDYICLVRTAEREENERLSLVIQTICATGIRVSELRVITVDAVYSGKAEINNKGKRRTIFLTEKLRRLLKNICKKKKELPVWSLSQRQANHWTGLIFGVI